MEGEEKPWINDKYPADKNQRAGTNSGFTWGLCAKQLLFKQLKMTLRQRDSDRKQGADVILVVKNAGRSWRTAEPWAQALKRQIKVFLEKKLKIMCTKKEMFLTLLTYNIRLDVELHRGLRNTISDYEVFNDSITIGSDRHPKVNSVWETYQGHWTEHKYPPWSLFLLSY